MSATPKVALAPVAVKNERTTRSTWHRAPAVYEISTWVWLTDLGKKYGNKVDLSCVPSSEWDSIANYSFDAVWLMGVWQRSPAGIAVANCNPGLLQDFRRALPDFRTEDNVGSPYCVRKYVVDEHLGGAKGLAVARRELADRGLNLILDFVPNHVAPDHPWVREHAEYFIQGNAEDVTNDPNSYIQVDGNIFACGRDPYFPAWPDVLQLNAFNPGLRNAVIETVASIADQCDGIRCDMAMLVMNSIFERTWGARAGRRPATEYWVDTIRAIKKQYPGFLFIAEAYWDLEWELQQQGFDFCYDKKLYDRLEHKMAEGVRLHLCADAAYQNKLIRFIENHDEPRAATTFSQQQEEAAAVVTATTPGAKLYHEGQFEGRKVRPPVFLGRRPEEKANPELQSFYTRLMCAVASPAIREGEWALCECSGWPDNRSFENLAAWTWTKDREYCLIVVNLSQNTVQGCVHVTWPGLGSRKVVLHDVLSGSTYERDGRDVVAGGLYVELPPWGQHFFQCSAIPTAIPNEQSGCPCDLT